MLVQVYGREAVSRKCVYEWFKRFREGKETTEDEPRSGRPSTSRTSEMIEKVRQMLAEERRPTLRLIVEELGISKDTVHIIVRDDLSKRKISRFVPYKLTDEERAKRVETSFPCVTRIHCFWKISSREMRPGSTISTRNENGNRWRGVHRLPRDQTRVVCKNPSYCL